MQNYLYRILRWSERYTRTDMVYLAKGGFWTGVKRVFGIPLGIGLSIALANLLTPEDFGVYKFVLAFAGIITAFSLTGMSTAVMQAVAQGYEGAVSQGLRENLRWSFGMVVIALGGSLYYFYNDNQVLGTSLLFVAASLPLIHSFDLYSPLLKGRKAFKTDTIYALPRLILPPALIIIAVFYTQNPVILVGVYFLSQAVIVVVSYVLAVYTQQLNHRLPKNLTFSKHLSLMNVLDIVASNIDKILVFHYLGAAQLAIYALALAPVRELRRLRSFFFTPAFPKFSQRSLPELKRSLPPRMVLLFFFVSLVVVLYILAAPYIYQYIFPQYMDSVLFSQVFALTLLFMPISVLPEVLTAHLKKKPLYIIRIITPLARILFIVILLPLYGIWGIIGAIFCMYIVNTLITVFLFTRTT